MLEKKKAITLNYRNNLTKRIAITRIKMPDDIIIDIIFVEEFYKISYMNVETKLISQV